MTQNEISIHLRDLKWEYPFIPKRNNYSYFIDIESNTLKCYLTKTQGSILVYETPLDVLDYALKEKTNERN